MHCDPILAPTKLWHVRLWHVAVLSSSLPYTHMHTHACTHTHSYVHTHTYTHTHTRTHTHTHTHTQVLVVHIDTDDEDSSRITEFFGIEEDGVPTSRLINLAEDMKKFVPAFNDLDAAKLKPWIQDYLDGKLKVGDRVRVCIVEVGEGVHSGGG